MNAHIVYYVVVIIGAIGACGILSGPTISKSQPNSTTQTSPTQVVESTLPPTQVAKNRKCVFVVNRRNGSSEPCNKGANTSTNMCRRHTKRFYETGATRDPS
jgi:hypothetical protein